MNALFVEQNLITTKLESVLLVNQNLLINPLMTRYFFEWDINNFKSNILKHNVDFEEAATVLADTNALTVYDSTHSENEDRWYTIGMSNRGRLLVMNHTYKESTDKTAIRIFSARLAEKPEQKHYNERI